MEKTKIMRCEVRSGQAEDSGKYPCVVCRKGVGSNSITCTRCIKWIHHRCSGIPGKLQDVVASEYICPKCVDGKEDSVKEREFRLGATDKLEIVDKLVTSEISWENAVDRRWPRELE